MRRVKRNGEKEHGQAVLEFSLIAIVLALVIMGILAFGLILVNQISLEPVAKAAAREANLRTMHTEYCARAPGDHYNGPIYDAVIQNLGRLEQDHIDSIVIFQATDDGHIRTDRQDILDAAGNLQTAAFSNSERCSDLISIGIELRYIQEVPVPLVNRITGDPILLHARVIMHIE